MAPNIHSSDKFSWNVLLNQCQQLYHEWSNDNSIQIRFDGLLLEMMKAYFSICNNEHGFF